MVVLYFDRLNSETMDGTVCELIYDLEFCDQVAYSVPAIGNSPVISFKYCWC